MSILSAIHQATGQSRSLDELARLPQSLIMQMVQNKEISQDQLAPILSRKAEIADTIAKTHALANGKDQQQPTVMDNLMAKNALAEHPLPHPEQEAQQMAQQMPQAPEEAGVGQLPIPNRSYAGGGIIAFGDGGDVDPEEEDDDKLEMSMAQHAAKGMEGLMAGIKNVPRQLSELSSILPKSYEATKAEMASTPTKTGGHKYEDAVIAEAKRQGVDPQLALHVLYKETGGHKTPESAVSKAGAIGPMQLMPNTAKSLGVDPKDPMQNIYGGVKYLSQLGKMFNNDPRLTAAAYNAGPGNVRKHGGVPNFKETQGYVQGLARGGEVRHFDTGDLVSLNPTPTYTPREKPDTQIVETIDPMSGDIIRVPVDKKIAAESVKKTEKSKQPSFDKNAAVDQYLNNYLSQQNAQNAPTVQPTNNPNPRQMAEQNYFEKMLARNDEERKRINDSAKEDKNLALMAAGLGMMGGTSPYAMANIGQGGLHGLQSLAASKTRRAAELTALNKGEATQAYYGEIAKQRQDVAGMNKANLLRDDFARRENDIRSSITKMAQANPRISALPPDQQQALINKQIQDALANDQYYKSLANQLGFNPTSTSTSPPMNYNFKTRSLG